jgi:hypothetical protein
MFSGNNFQKYRNSQLVEFDSDAEERNRKMPKNRQQQHMMNYDKCLLEDTEDNDEYWEEITDSYNCHLIYEMTFQKMLYNKYKHNMKLVRFTIKEIKDCFDAYECSPFSFPNKEVISSVIAHILCNYCDIPKRRNEYIAYLEKCMDIMHYSSSLHDSLVSTFDEEYAKHILLKNATVINTEI